MNPKDPFLQAIIESPDDDGLRRIYADFLEEKDERERAEFIRVQCALANLTEDDPRRPGLEAHERALLTEHEQEWAGPLAGLCEGWTFRRGLVEAVEVQAETFRAQADDLFRLAPIRQVRITELGDRLADFIRSPYLGRVTALDLTLNEVGDAGAEVLAASEGIVGLRVLILAGCGIGPSGARALLSSPYLARLTTLHLTGNNLSECDAETLFRNWQLVRLAELSLQGTFIDVQGLVRVPHLAQLTVLDLSENDLRFEDEDAQALAACEYLTGLTWLDLGHCNIGAAGAQALASSPYLGRLTTLRLWHNSIEPAGVEALVSSASLGKLTSLDLSSNGIGDAGARALADSPPPGGPVRLDLSNNEISEAVQQALRARFGDRVKL